MIELRDDELHYSFPEVHPDARLTVEFQRTLRIPDDDNTYPLPPGLGCFPLRHVDDFAARIPEAWTQHGGVMLPMYQSEALWLNFNCHAPDGVEYPFAIKVATGKVNAVTGDPWSEGLHRRPQDYMVAPDQPWLDGYCVQKGVIRQFVAMPLGSGYSVEEQVTGEAAHGGMQIAVYPAKREVYEKLLARHKKRFSIDRMLEEPDARCCCASMGFAMGGRMHQQIYEDPHGLHAWETDAKSRCFVHIANSLTWRDITGSNPPTVPFTAHEYTRAGLPWYDYYSDSPALSGSPILSGVKSIATLADQKGDTPLPENQPVTPKTILQVGKKPAPGQVREGVF